MSASLPATNSPITTLKIGALTETATPKQGKRLRIVVAMSGGVDSSVAAALLKTAGHDVIGITLQLYDHGEATRRKGSCCAGQDIHDARRVADHLGIPHYVLDYEQRFQTAVMQSFADSYLAGETPIPCITCNSQIKFKDLLDTARELGADFLATGHYIARRETPTGPKLLRAADTERDQSYFLFNTTPAQLQRLWFPLGDMRKPEVRAIAARLALPVAEKPDSQDICFVPTGRYTDIIERLKPGAVEGGDIVHVDGRLLGRHDGIVHFTVGQRRGLKIAAAEPLFVVRLDATQRRVIVGPRDALRTVALMLKTVNWLGEAHVLRDAAEQQPSVEPIEVFVRIRSSHPPRPARLHLGRNGDALIELHEGEDGVSAGQACVFYEDATDQARVLGGGWIARSVGASDPRIAARVASNDAAFST